MVFGFCSFEKNEDFSRILEGGGDEEEKGKKVQKNREM